MAVSTISAMPAAPSRVGDAASFFAESLAFLEAQPDLVTEANAVGTYLNAAKFNPNDWGDLTAIGAGASPVSITTHIPTPPSNPPLTGFDFANGMDATLAAFSGFVTEANAVASYVDGFTDLAAPVIVEPDRPAVSIVADSPARGDAQGAFNTKALSFYSSARAFGYALNALADYATQYLAGEDDFGLTGEAITATDDWGNIT